MACGDFQQIRIGEYLHFQWSVDDLDDDPLDASDAIDVGGFRELTVTVLVTKATIGMNGTMTLKGMTAAINNETYYGETSDSGITFSAVSGEPEVFIATFETLSRFWLPVIAVSGADGGTSSTLSCTIDVVAR